MKKIFLFLLVHAWAQLPAQNADTTFYHQLRLNDLQGRAEKRYLDSITTLVNNLQATQRPADSTGFDRIFGCSCCSDTLRGFAGSTELYILSEHKTRLTAYRNGKKKWSATCAALFGGNKAEISCMEFYGAKGGIVLCLSAGSTAQSIDLDPRSGRPSDKRKKQAQHTGR